MSWAMHLACTKFEWNKPLRRPRHRWKDNIKTGLKDWTGFSWLRIGTSGRRWNKRHGNEAPCGKNVASF
jgi:hypothetical protein